MSAPTTDEGARATAVPSAVLASKIDYLASEVLELRRGLSGLVSREFYVEARSADQRRIEQLEIAQRAAEIALAARRDLDERERNARRWQLGVAVLSAVVAIVLSLINR